MVAQTKLISKHTISTVSLKKCPYLCYRGSKIKLEGNRRRTDKTVRMIYSVRKWKPLQNSVLPLEMTKYEPKWQTAEHAGKWQKRCRAEEEPEWEEQMGTEPQRWWERKTNPCSAFHPLKYSSNKHIVLFPDEFCLSLLHPSLHRLDSSDEVMTSCLILCTGTSWLIFYRIISAWNLTSSPPTSVSKRCQWSNPLFFCFFLKEGYRQIWGASFLIEWSGLKLCICIVQQQKLQSNDGKRLINISFKHLKR